jgi:hypothetical protein
VKTATKAASLREPMGSIRFTTTTTITSDDDDDDRRKT